MVCAAHPPLPAATPAGGDHAPGTERGWKTTRTAPSGCDTPYRWVGPGADTATAALLGDTRAGSTPGCDPTYILDVIDFGAAQRPGDHCTVTFNATLWLGAGERAAVVLVADSSVAAYEIPGSRGGRTGRYAAAVVGRGTVRLIFAVWNSASAREGTRSLLAIDKVEAYTTGEDISSTTLKPIGCDEIPFDPMAIDGQGMESMAGPADCNENGLPDGFEISQGMAPDRDADGLPDTCQGRRQTDGVLLILGLVALTAVLVRFLLKQRVSKL